MSLYFILLSLSPSPLFCLPHFGNFRLCQSKHQDLWYDLKVLHSLALPISPASCSSLLLLLPLRNCASSYRSAIIQASLSAWNAFFFCASYYNLYSFSPSQLQFSLSQRSSLSHVPYHQILWHHIWILYNTNNDFNCTLSFNHLVCLPHQNVISVRASVTSALHHCISGIVPGVYRQIANILNEFYTLTYLFLYCQRFLYMYLPMQHMQFLQFYVDPILMVLFLKIIKTHF